MKIKNQPRILGVKRVPLGSCLLKDLRRHVAEDARREGVSKSWVVAVILADHYHMQTADYRDAVRRRAGHLRRVG